MMPTLKEKSQHWFCPCDGCDGEMTATGSSRYLYQMEWLHFCSKCGYEDYASNQYPSFI